ncbi:hypothetical protein TURU_004411 [Turdus rufiventris]|nr:hypothetical protein TURU_004411 [Turdus rufiventris]
MQFLADLVHGIVAGYRLLPRAAEERRGRQCYRDEVHVSLVLKSRELALQLSLTWAEQRARITWLDLLAMLFLMHSKTPLSLATSGSWTACCAPGPPGPSSQSSFPADQTQPVLVPGVIPTQCRILLCFAFGESQTFILCPSLHPVKAALWDIGHCSLPCVISDLLRRHLSLYPNQ